MTPPAIPTICTPTICIPTEEERLLDAAEGEAARRGCGQIVLLTHAANAGAAGERWEQGLRARGPDRRIPVGDAALWFRKVLDPGPPTS